VVPNWELFVYTPAVFVRMAYTRLTEYVTWKSAEALDSKVFAAGRFSAFALQLEEEIGATPPPVKSKRVRKA
jgi:hypothetical protein